MGRLRLLSLVPLALLLLAGSDLYRIQNYPADSYACPSGTILVMGAAQYDGRPSPAFQRRLDRAAELYAEGCSERIVVSGGSREGDRYSEGAAGVNYLAAQGVPRAAMQAETRARNSAENLELSLPLVEGSLLIVTDDLHAHRSQWLARHLGQEDVSVATVPAGGPRLVYAGRELLSLLSYQLGIVR